MKHPMHTQRVTHRGAALLCNRSTARAAWITRFAWPKTIVVISGMI
jgi:hypothetical protein